MTGLRERKRHELRSNIERAAVALVLEHGYDHVTVDMICAAAEASQRTFFNYFGSKEAAVLGPPPPSPDPAWLEEFVDQPRGDALSDLVRLMTRTIVAAQPDPKLLASRREIVGSTPVLMQAQAARFAAKDEELTELVLRRFMAQGRPERAPDLAAEARMIVSLWAGFIRFTVRPWSATGHADLAQELEAGAAVLDRTIANLAIVRQG